MLTSIRFFFAVVGRLSPALAGWFAAKLFAWPRRHPRPARERELIARGARLNLPGGLYATAWGAGPTVLLVHGWEGRGAQLGAFVDPLVAAGYRVVALDGPAHGDSPGRTTTGPEFARALIATRDVVGPLAAVVRSEEHTSELQSRGHLVCRLLREQTKTRLPTRPDAVQPPPTPSPPRPILYP